MAKPRTSRKRSGIIKAIKKTGLTSITKSEILDELGIDSEEYKEPKLKYYDDIDDDDYISQSQTEDISFVELAIINDYLHESYRGKHKDIVVSSYGEVDTIGRLSFGGAFDVTSSFWFISKIKGDNNDLIIQTRTFLDNRNELVNNLVVTTKKGLVTSQFDDMIKHIKKVAFNNSRYKGKCVTIKLNDGRFRGIEIIDLGEKENELILNETQSKWIEHFIKRVGRGGNARYLLNGQPGCGKTQSIREIARRLMPKVTFIIPEFTTSDDLTSILESCEIFDNGVIIIDDIDLYLGSRENGSYTGLLGQFLSFFDGVKKRNISLLASTNDKSLVDRASERPGRFNITLDYGYLNEEQIVKVCNIHLPKKYQVEEVYNALKGKVNGKKANITGAFISNLADNIKEMSEDDKTWKMDDTLSLIIESYKGFYHSQVDKEKESMGFNIK